MLRQRPGDPPSLQVLAPAMNRFVRIHPAQDAFIINVGDVLQVLTNERYRAPVHRVLVADRDRYSSPLFLNPRYDSLCSPRVLEEGEASLYKPFTWGEFRRKRFEGDFEDAGYDEVQVRDYRLSQQQRQQRPQRQEEGTSRL